MTDEIDIVDETQPIRSGVIQEFLSTVKSGERFAFFDLDGTITSPEFDVEDHAVVNYLIEPARFDEWTSQVLRKYPGDFRYIYKDRNITRAFLVENATAQLLRDVGRKTGKYLIEKKLLQEGAWETITTCVTQGIKVVVLTASPGDVARGVIEEIAKQKNMAAEIAVIGSEFDYSSRGVTENLWMRGPNKTYVVESVKAKRARAILGAGDSPSYSDAFVGHCEISVVVDQKDELAILTAWKQARSLLESV